MFVKIFKDQLIIGKNIKVADTFLLRLTGLIPRKYLGPGEGLLIQPCRQVHTWFMSFAIDIVFLDKDNKILHLISSMERGKVSPLIKNGLKVLELPKGTIETHKLEQGDILNFEDTSHL